MAAVHPCRLTRWWVLRQHSTHFTTPTTNKLITHHSSEEGSVDRARIRKGTRHHNTWINISLSWLAIWPARA